jgi:hypothetical protein
MEILYQNIDPSFNLECTGKGLKDPKYLQNLQEKSYLRSPLGFSKWVWVLHSKSGLSILSGRLTDLATL